MRSPSYRELLSQLARTAGPWTPSRSHRGTWYRRLQIDIYKIDAAIVQSMSRSSTWWSIRGEPFDHGLIKFDGERTDYERESAAIAAADAALRAAGWVLLDSIDEEVP